MAEQNVDNANSLLFFVDVLVQARTSDGNSQRILSRKMAEQNVDNAKSLLYVQLKFMRAR